jgi:hypothetical protein
MAFMAAALPYISAAASIGSALGQGEAQNKIANIQAQQLRKQALADKAEAVQTAKFERQKKDFLLSRVTALAAASGADVSSINIQNSLSDIDEQGEYNALAALYSGYSSADSKSYAADVAVAQGKQAKASGYASAASTILSSADNKFAPGSSYG